ncbi:MAG: hypothetical protein GY847_18625 [Proteobacteria bacterium]|nr:hypothetical protein [Pseudomonadota bacterium]
MSTEAWIGPAVQRPSIAPAFETIGANGAYVLYEKGNVTALDPKFSVPYIGLYDKDEPGRQKNWPADFSPDKVEGFFETLTPTADELSDYAYTGTDPAKQAKQIAAKAAIEDKAQRWFKKITKMYRDCADDWFSDIGLDFDQNSILAVQYYHPKLTAANVFGQTAFWPAGISINLANPGSNVNTMGHPDRPTWRFVLGFNKEKTSVIFKDFGTPAELSATCRHEIGHATKSAFYRARFGPGDHSSSGLMFFQSGAGVLFSNSDSAKLRGLP